MSQWFEHTGTSHTYTIRNWASIVTVTHFRTFSSIVSTYKNLKEKNYDAKGKL